MLLGLALGAWTFAEVIWGSTDLVLRVAVPVAVVADVGYPSRVSHSRSGAVVPPGMHTAGSHKTGRPSTASRSVPRCSLRELDLRTRVARGVIQTSRPPGHRRSRLPLRRHCHHLPHRPVRPFDDGHGTATAVVGARGAVRNGSLRQHLCLPRRSRTIRDWQPRRHRWWSVTSPSQWARPADAGQRCVPRPSCRPRRRSPRSSRHSACPLGTSVITFEMEIHHHVDASRGCRLGLALLVIARQALLLLDHRHELFSVSDGPHESGSPKSNWLAAIARERAGSCSVGPVCQERPVSYSPDTSGTPEAPSGDTEAAIPNDRARPHGRHQAASRYSTSICSRPPFPLIGGNVGQVGGKLPNQNATSVNRKISCGGRGSETRVRRLLRGHPAAVSWASDGFRSRGWRWPYAVKAVLGKAPARK